MKELWYLTGKCAAVCKAVTLRVCGLLFRCRRRHARQSFPAAVPSETRGEDRGAGTGERQAGAAEKDAEERRDGGRCKERQTSTEDRK